MKSLLALLILILTISAPLRCRSESAADVERNRSVSRIAKTIRCLTCNGGAVYDSGSSFAITMRKFIEEELVKGKSEQEVVDEVVRLHGKDILLNPLVREDASLILLTLPLLCLLMGAAKIVRDFFVNYKKQE